MKEREQASDSTASSKRRRHGVKFEFEFNGEGEERIINWIVETMERKGEKASEKVKDDGEVNDREET